MTETSGQSLGQRMFHEIKTLEEAQNYILDLVSKVEKARKQCDELHMASALMGSVPRETVEKSYRNLSVRYGQTLGALTTLMHVRVLTDEAYSHLRARVDMAMLPKVLGVMESL